MSNLDAIEYLDIPVIDLSNENVQTADHLVEAFIQYGFAFVHGRGLGFTSQIMDDLFEVVGLICGLSRSILIIRLVP